MELRHLRYFVGVAEELHFGRAADRLGISQPPLSKQIRDLEAEIGSVLLNRTSRRVELTSAGEAFLLEARALLRTADRAIDTARRIGAGQAGRLGVGAAGATATGYLAEAAREFSERAPGVELYFKELPRDVPSQARVLQARDVDVGIVRIDPGEADLTSDVVAEETLVAVLPAGHPLAAADRVALHELLREPLVGPDPGTESSQFIFDRLIGRQPERFVRAEGGPSILLGLVAAGFGVTLLPESACALHREGVVYRRLQPTLRVPVRVAWRLDDLQPTAKLFIETLRASARSSGPGA